MSIPTSSQLPLAAARMLIMAEIKRKRQFIANHERHSSAQAEFPSVTKVPFILCPLHGSFTYLSRNQPAQSIDEHSGLFNVPRSMVNIQHQQIRCYLRLTFDDDYTLIGRSTRLTPIGTPAAQDDQRIEALVLPGMPGVARGRLLEMAECLPAVGEQANEGQQQRAGLLWQLLLHDLLTLLAAQNAEHGGGSSARSHQQRQFQQVRAWVEAHAHEAMSRDQAARALGCSPGHLTRILKRHANCGFSTFVQTERLQRACVLLEDGEMSVTDVAHHCGFDNADYFSVVFSQHFGMPPSHWSRR